MKITDPARDVLKEVIEENNADGLRVVIQETCCGKSPMIGLDVFEEGEARDSINGIDIAIPEEARDLMEEVEIDLVNGELVILNTVCGCGGNCDHHHE